MEQAPAGTHKSLLHSDLQFLPILPIGFPAPPLNAMLAIWARNPGNDAE